MVSICSFWFKDKLIRAVSAIEENNCNAYSSNVTAFWPDGKEALIDKAQPLRKWDYFFEAAGPGIHIDLLIDS